MRSAYRKINQKNDSSVAASKLKRRSNDPVALTLDLIGDKWSLIIIRDMIYHKKNSYGDFLNSAERISTNILNDRLVKLTKSGIITYTVQN